MRIQTHHIIYTVFYNYSFYVEQVYGETARYYAVSLDPDKITLLAGQTKYPDSALGKMLFEQVSKVEHLVGQRTHCQHKIPMIMKKIQEFRDANKS